MTLASRSLAFCCFSVVFSGFSRGESHPVAPKLNSNPSATYTLYLDFSGFNFNGTWGNTGKSPGTVPTFSADADRTTFSAADIKAISETWAAVAQKYVGFNINITTVDPAAAGLTDAQRQSFYDTQPRMMHTIFGGRSTDWFGSAGGVSFVGMTQSANVGSGYHTNWVFADTEGNVPKYMAEAGAHENGHGLKLNHQHDENTGAEYSTNGSESNTNPKSTGTGSYAPLMGVGYYSQRGTWRIGSAAKGNANDVAVLETNSGMGALRDDGIGHSFANATSLPVNANGSVNVNSSASKGFILPKASVGYSATGEDSYTKDYFSFHAAGGLVTLTANDGTSYLQAGVADPGATMRSILRIYNQNFDLIGTAVEDASTLLHTFTGMLATGDYLAQVVSYGGYLSAYEPNTTYFNMGGYFLTGSGFAQAIPEPTALFTFVVASGGFIRRRRLVA